jgi:hypothetical protein
MFRLNLMAEILSNSKARRDYHILETFEAGIVLHGTEVNSRHISQAGAAGTEVLSSSRLRHPKEQGLPTARPVGRR